MNDTSSAAVANFTASAISLTSRTAAPSAFSVCASMPVIVANALSDRIGFSGDFQTETRTFNAEIAIGWARVDTLPL